MARAVDIPNDGPFQNQRPVRPSGRRGVSAACSKRTEAAGTESRFQGRFSGSSLAGHPAAPTICSAGDGSVFGRHVPGIQRSSSRTCRAPGASLALKYLAHEARPDGLAIGQVDLPGTWRESPTIPRHKPTRHRFHALGSPADDVPVCVFRAPAGSI